jgi:hypothetical protein
MIRMDATLPSSDPPDDDLGGEREVVQRHLEQRFPEVDPNRVAEVIEEAAAATVGAKIQSFRPLLVEHRASDMIRHHLSV